MKKYFLIGVLIVLVGFSLSAKNTNAKVPPQPCKVCIAGMEGVKGVVKMTILQLDSLKEIDLCGCSDTTTKIVRFEISITSNGTVVSSNSYSNNISSQMESLLLNSLVGNPIYIDNVYVENSAGARYKVNGITILVTN